MADDVDERCARSQANIAKLDAILKEAEETLARGDKLMEDNNVSADTLHAFIGQQSQEGAQNSKRRRRQSARRLSATCRSRRATRPTRVRPTRQMI